jgi:hypothetical protein
MTTISQNNASIDAHRIPEYLPRTWAAAEVVYSKCTFSYENGTLAFGLSPSSVAYPETDINVFLQALFDGTLPPGRPIPPLPSPAPGVLDQQVDNCSYLVLELDESVKWQFHRTGVGVTTLQDYGDTNAQLRHCRKTAGGYVLMPNVDPGPGCTLIYFSVVARAGAGKQKFNFHVELLQPAPDAPLPVVIDPDVGNPNPIPPV